jgi:hypothetical protein
MISPSFALLLWLDPTRAGSQIAHSLDKAGDKEGIIVMLFMHRKHEVVEYFAAGNRGVISQYGMDEPGAVL